MKKLLTIIFISTLLASCGRYGPPIAPEARGPKMIEDFSITTQDNTINLSWKSPTKDRTNSDLKSLTGFNIERASLGEGRRVNLSELNFTNIATTVDESIEDLRKRREEAYLSGLPSRKVKIDPLKNLHSFQDKLNFITGSRYFYRITPFNKNSIGDQSLARVIYKGKNSQVDILTSQNKNNDPLEQEVRTELVN